MDNFDTIEANCTGPGKGHKDVAFIASHTLLYSASPNSFQMEWILRGFRFTTVDF